jgi:acetylornithine aminotransferase
MKNIVWSNGHKLRFCDIVKADNCYLYNVNGKRFVDLESGVWCTNIGHNNKKVNKAISNQLKKITHTGFCYANPQIDITAKKLLAITDMPEGKCEFFCSGSEAVEFGLRVSRTINESKMVLAFSDSYFGAYGDAYARNSDKWYIYNRLECSCKGGEGCKGDCESFQKIPFSKIGVFLFEPGSSSGHVRFPSKSLIEKIVSKIRSNKGIFIANEVTTGIGRTGKWFGYQHYPVHPDIIAMGKGLGNGYPVSAAVLSENITSLLSTIKFVYAQSHQNDPLGAAVAAQVIDVITGEKLLSKCNRKGDFLRVSLNRMKRSYPIIKDVRGRGLMIALEFTSRSEEVYEELLESGFIVCKRPGTEVLRIDPALTISRSSLKQFLNTLESIIANKR